MPAILSHNTITKAVQLDVVILPSDYHFSIGPLSSFRGSYPHIYSEYLYQINTGQIGISNPGLHFNNKRGPCLFITLPVLESSTHLLNYQTLERLLEKVEIPKSVPSNPQIGIWLINFWGGSKIERIIEIVERWNQLGEIKGYVR